jgi:hypothetical protein
MSRYRVPAVLALLLLATVPLIATAAPFPPAGLSQADSAWPGPDGFGYTGAAADYQWIEISASGTPVALNDDDWDGPFSIGFSFPFYGVNWTQFYIASDGYLSFGNGTTDFTNDCPLPNAAPPNNIIALMWDDLDPGATDDLAYYQSLDPCPIGEGPCLVVQFENYHLYPGGMGQVAGTFEAVLFAHGSVLVQFQDAGTEQGADSTTAIEGNNAPADYGLTYACNSAGSLTDELAVCFAYPGSPGCPVSGGAVGVEVDIKPRSCPNAVNPRDQGVLPVAVLGTADFDVTTINPSFVRLRGAIPLRYAYEDVAAPVVDRQDVCDCTTAGPDGYLDLVLHFDMQRLVVVPDTPPQDPIALPLTGLLWDGTEITGQDCIVIVGAEVQ